jgi:hypothetical protein
VAIIVGARADENAVFAFLGDFLKDLVFRGVLSRLCVIAQVGGEFYCPGWDNCVCPLYVGL